MVYAGCAGVVLGGLSRWIPPASLLYYKPQQPYPCAVPLGLCGFTGLTGSRV